MAQHRSESDDDTVVNTSWLQKIAQAACASQDGRILIPANPEQPGFLMACTHPEQGICLVHVGQATKKEVRVAMHRSGTRPLRAADE
ncbi:MAG: hypothetical protein HKL99_14020 [Burkholderiales bacterium]|nr:hypothetical protein [Burkholderiales bacterium]